MTNAKKSSLKKKKLVTDLKLLTPNCKKMYAEYRKSCKLLSFNRKCRRSLKFSKNQNFEEKIRAMNPFALKLFKIQIEMCTKKKKARRYTLDEKLIALAILKQGPKCYRFLQKIFILPSVSTLKKLISKVNLEAGINPVIFECLKEEVCYFVSLFLYTLSYCYYKCASMYVCYTFSNKYSTNLDETS